MKNTVNFETARKLKDAGFPKPQPEFGQVWYDDDGAYVIGQVNGVSISGAWNGGNTFEDAYIGIDDIFAPTATDILLNIPDGYRLTRVNGDMFICTENEALWGDDGCEVNPAEAAALTWLAIHEKQPQK